MSYRQEGLDGEGTSGNPFLIRSYEDWKIIDARYDIDDIPPCYSLETDLNFMFIREDFQGANFLGGTLLMNNHSIINPHVKLGSYLIRFATVIGGPLEKLNYDGTVDVKGGEGKIIGVKGTHVEMLLNKCILKRVYLDMEIGDMNIDRQDNSLLGQVAGEQCFIALDNNGFSTHPLIACLPMDDRASFVDTCFEFTGLAFDAGLIDRFYETETPEKPVLDHCMIRGSLDCGEMTRHYTSSDTYIVGGAVKSCIVNINGKNARDEQGYKGLGTFIDISAGPSLAIQKTGFYMGIEDPTKVIKVYDADYRKVEYNKTNGFDVIKVR